jgi:hypothetical protein
LTVAGCTTTGISRPGSRGCRALWRGRIGWTPRRLARHWTRAAYAPVRRGASAQRHILRLICRANYFQEPLTGEVRRILLPRASVNKASQA